MSAQNVYLPILSTVVGGKNFSLTRGNPGVGGSQFTTIQFGILLALRRPDWRVVLLSDADFGLDPHPANLKIEQACTAAEACHWLEYQPPGITIWMAMHAETLESTFAAEVPGRHVLWSRHPFDPTVRRFAADRATVDVVCVGEYQWYSNYSSRIPVHYIQEAFLAPQCDRAPEIRRRPSDEVHIAHISSLVRVKGLLEIAMAWRELKQALPGVRLHVIGGSNLYGWQADGRLIPTAPDFEREILRYLPEEDIRSGVVTFHGVMGDEKFNVLKRCHFVIQNTTGISEAFPASPLEAMSVGLPVIGADDYGMADCMRHFPDLVVHGPRGIAGRAAWLIADEERYANLQRRAYKHAVSVRATEEDVLNHWEHLLVALASGKPVRPALLPRKPFHGSMAKLIYRREILPRLVRMKRRLLGQD